MHLCGANWSVRVVIERDFREYFGAVGYNIAKGDQDKCLTLVRTRYRSFNYTSVGLKTAHRK
jgi:hypothetical protein